MEARGQKNVRFTEWVSRLPEVIKALNNEETRIIGIKPSDVSRRKRLWPSLPPLRD